MWEKMEYISCADQQVKELKKNNGKTACKMVGPGETPRDLSRYGMTVLEGW